MLRRTNVLGAWAWMKDSPGFSFLVFLVEVPQDFPAYGSLLSVSDCIAGLNCRGVRPSSGTQDDQRLSNGETSE